MRFCFLIVTAFSLFLPLSSPCESAALADLTIAVLSPPSLGAFLPPVIKDQHFDEQNGLRIKFVELTPDAYSTEFNSGQYEIGGSAALLTVGLASIRGVDAVYLFNAFDFWTSIVTTRSDVRTLKDLEGKDLAASKGTTIYEMFRWFARRAGLDLSKVGVVNTGTSGLLGYIVADRAAAVHMWEPGYTLAKAKLPQLRSLDLQLYETWEKTTGTRRIPYIGVAAHKAWADRNPEAIANLFKIYKAAADWTLAHPDQASAVIMPKATALDQKAVADLIRAQDRLQLDVRWADDIRKELSSVYDAGREIGLLSRDPGPDTIYKPASK